MSPATNTDQTAIRFRLSAAQMSVIWPGLDLIVRGYVAYRDKKNSSYRSALRADKPGLVLGIFDSKAMDQIVALWKALRPKAEHGGRVHMTTMQVRAAIFSVRINLDMRRKQKHDKRKLNAETKRRFGVDQRSLKALGIKAQRVVRTLERYMKRANRALRASLPHNECAALLKAWQMHLRWMRVSLVYYRQLPPIVKGRKKRQQLILNALVVMAEQGLRSAGYDAPEANDMRKLMRLYARSARRCREGSWTLEKLTKLPTSFNAKYHLANFIMQRRELKELPEP